MNQLLEHEITTKEAVNIPTLLIGGKKSNFVPIRYMPQMKKLFPNAKVEWLETGHWVQAEDPSNFLKIVTKFLQD